MKKSATYLTALLLAACDSAPAVFIEDPALGGGGTGSNSNGGDSGAGNSLGPSFNTSDAGPSERPVTGDVVIHDRNQGNGAVLDGGVLTPGSGMLPDVTFDYVPTGNGMSAQCATASGGAVLNARPVDIIVSIDNSGSMTQEIVNVQQQITENFSEILQDSGIDYRVIMVSKYGWVQTAIGSSNNPVCIAPPLGNAECTADDIPPLAFPGPSLPEPETQRFFHYSVDVDSNNMWCVLLDSYDAMGTLTDGNGDHPLDDSGLAPDGWQEWLRPGSFKMFIGITDDHSGEDGCGEFPAYNFDNASLVIQEDLTFDGPGDQDDLDAELQGARDFDEELRTLAPEHFGEYDAADPDQGRNYRWYSVVAYADGSGPADEGQALGPDEPLRTGLCEAVVDDPFSNGTLTNEGEGSGVGYQYLSVLTGALRFPSCYTDQYSTIFQDVAQGVQEAATVPCEFNIDLDAINGIVNPNNVTVRYTPGTGDAETFTRVEARGDCSAQDEYYFEFASDGQPNRVVFCPSTCDKVQADKQSSVQIDFGCLEN